MWIHRDRRCWSTAWRSPANCWPKGHPFRLLEEEATLLRNSRGKGIQPRTQEVLDDLGLIQRFRAVGGRYPELVEDVTAYLKVIGQ
jgi:hypothetical protein